MSEAKKKPVPSISRVEATRQKLAQLQKRLDDMERERAEAAERAFTRKKVIVGAFFVGRYEGEALPVPPDLRTAFAAYLTKPADRRLFGLDAPPAPASGEELAVQAEPALFPDQPRA